MLDEPAEQILDAAAESYLQHGRSGTTLTDIARRAGVSRPTVYKHLGDLDTITATLVERELEIFFGRLEEILDATEGARRMLADALVFSVSYARSHELLQRMLELDPLVILDRFTREASPIIDRALDLFEPRLSAACGTELPSDADPGALAELVVRTGLSMITTPSPRIDLDDPDQLRAFVTASLPWLRDEAHHAASTRS